MEIQGDRQLRIGVIGKCTRVLSLYRTNDEGHRGHEGMSLIYRTQASTSDFFLFTSPLNHKKYSKKEDRTTAAAEDAGGQR